MYSSKHSKHDKCDCISSGSRLVLKIMLIFLSPQWPLCCFDYKECRRKPTNTAASYRSKVVAGTLSFTQGKGDVTRPHFDITILLFYIIICT